MVSSPLPPLHFILAHLTFLLLYSHSSTQHLHHHSIITPYSQSPQVQSKDQIFPSNSHREIPKTLLFTGYHSKMDKNDFFPWTQIPITFPIPSHHSLMNYSKDLNFYNTSSNWDYPFDQNDNFESALSSMVSSPAASVTPAAVNGGDGVQLIQLIGELGNIYSPSGISHHCNNSSYSTPKNSPPKLNLTTEDQMRGKFPPFSTDPGFSERAAMLSCFGSRTFNKGIISQRLVNEQGAPGSQQNRIDHIHVDKALENQSDLKEESSISQKVQSNKGNGRKRKAIARGKTKITSKVDVESKESDLKRGNIDEVEKGGKSEPKEDSQPPEPPKDYIHVRARRGQATDSHSLAERVRREKLSGKMKFLQDLVPGCNNVTGKAVMLDEIINYVQSLQRQVEGLSMKLSTVNPIMDNAHMVALLSKEILQSRMYSVESNSVSAAFPYSYQSQEPPCLPNENSFNDERLRQSHHQNLQVLSINGFNNSASQVSMWGDELHNVVQMGFATGSMQRSKMKMEP